MEEVHADMVAFKLETLNSKIAYSEKHFKTCNQRFGMEEVPYDLVMLKCRSKQPKLFVLKKTSQAMSAWRGPPEGRVGGPGPSP